MGLNRERVGHRYPSYRYEVSREKVREYARAIGVGEIPDSGEVLAPPTFAACFTVARDEVMGDPELGAHHNLVHGRQAYTYHRPIRVGDVLECSPAIDDISGRGRMELLTVRTDCADAETGAPVLTAHSTIILFNETAEG